MPFVVTALIDLGVAIKLINQHLVEKLSLPTISCMTPLYE